MRTPSRLFALVLFTGLCAASVGRADYLYTVSGLPAPIVSGQSIVVVSANPTPNHPFSGTTSTNLAVGNVLGFSANTAGTDAFNTPFTMKLAFADPAAPGSEAIASFTGLLSGRLGALQTSLTLQFSNTPQTLDLAGNRYAVSVPTAPLMIRGDGTQNPFGVQVAYLGQAGGSTPTVPEPSTLLLAACAAPLGGLLYRRRRAARG